MSRSAPASPRARSICISPTRRRCSRNWCARSWCRVVGALETCARRPACRCARSSSRSIETVRARDLRHAPQATCIRLMISEGPRFPQLAEFYYREVLARADRGAARMLLQRAFERGELAERRVGALSATARRARHRRHHLERAVRAFRAARRRARMMRAHFDHLVRPGEGVMSAAIARLCAVLRCSRWRSRPATTPTTVYQGWVEANLIFVAPDEVGRVQTLSVREGDTVKTGEPLFTVDDELQHADVAQVKAALTNAQQTFDRAPTACQDRRRHAEGFRRGAGGAARCAGAAQLVADAAGAAQRLQPGRRHRAAGLFPPRRDGAGRPAGARAAAAGQHQGALLRAGGGAAARSPTATR